MIYLDYQATTPLAPEAREAMLPWLNRFGNPHSPHRLGREAAAAVEIAREQVMAAFQPFPAFDDLTPASGWGRASPWVKNTSNEGRLFFTGGATEAANWALKGSWARRAKSRNRIVTVSTEHACVLDAACTLTQEGADIVSLPVDREGLIDTAGAVSLIDETTAIVAVMLINNEIGVFQNLDPIAKQARAVGATIICDAVQGYGRVPIVLDNCDLAIISAHKAHGPKGVGALWVREGYEPDPLMHGGGQEGGLRSGTLSPMLCAGFGAAAHVASMRASEDFAHVERLYTLLRSQLGQEWHVNGARTARYRGNLNLRRDGIDAAGLISDVREVAFSAGSACSSGSGRPSHVLRAIGLTEMQVRSSIRLGFGRYTSDADVEEAAQLINAAAERQLVFTA